MQSYINFGDTHQKRIINVPQHGLTPPPLSQAFPRANHRSFNNFWLVGKITKLALFEAYYLQFLFLVEMAALAQCWTPSERWGEDEELQLCCFLGIPLFLLPFSNSFLFCQTEQGYTDLDHEAVWACDFYTAHESICLTDTQHENPTFALS